MPTIRNSKSTAPLNESIVGRIVRGLSSFFAIVGNTTVKANDRLLAPNPENLEMLSVMNRQMRTTLTSVMGSLELVLETPIEPEQRNLLSGALLSCRSQLTLLSTLNPKADSDGSTRPGSSPSEKANALRNSNELDSGQVLPPSNLAPITAGRSDADYKILVVEDNMVNKLVALATLKKFGLNADGVANGQEAIEALQKNTYDLVLMDCEMPVMGGFEATHIIRNSESTPFFEIPIVAMTANAMTGDADRCIDAGMDDYLAKPVETKKLITVVRKWLDIGHQRRLNRTPAQLNVSRTT